MPKTSKVPASGDGGRDSLLQFTVMVSGLSDPDSIKAYAIERGWIDADGNRTPAGIELDKALSDQSGTRSAFRGA
jgi:hypothetical protein